jgi:hypothetical protein
VKYTGKPTDAITGFAVNDATGAGAGAAVIFSYIIVVFVTDAFATRDDV